MKTFGDRPVRSLCATTTVTHHIGPKKNFWNLSINLLHVCVCVCRWLWIVNAIKLSMVDNGWATAMCIYIRLVIRKLKSDNYVPTRSSFHPCRLCSICGCRRRCFVHPNLIKNYIHFVRCCVRMSFCLRSHCTDSVNRRLLSIQKLHFRWHIACRMVG